MPDRRLHRPVFGEVVAEQPCVVVLPSGERRDATVRIGKPYPDGDNVWACPCEILGFEPRHPDMRGISSCQALALALALIRMRLTDIIAEGARVLHPDGDTDLDVDAILGVGEAIQKPER